MKKDFAERAKRFFKRKMISQSSGKEQIILNDKNNKHEKNKYKVFKFLGKVLVPF